MSNLPAKIFSSGTEYEIFKYNWCERCQKHKESEEGFPAFPEDGGCPIEDAIENAKFDETLFPSGNIRKLRSADDDSVICWHYCTAFSPIDAELFKPYFEMMKKALVKSEVPLYE